MIPQTVGHIVLPHSDSKSISGETPPNRILSSFKSVHDNESTDSSRGRANASGAGLRDERQIEKGMNGEESWDKLIRFQESFTVYIKDWTKCKL